MPRTKQYLRYSPSGSFNIIASSNCNGVWTSLKNQDGRFVATGACEDITIWDLQLGEKAAVIAGENSMVTVLCSMKKHIAAGFSDGTVKTFNAETGETSAVFSGHKSSVSCLNYDKDGHRLASGSKDTHVVVWDVVAENGIARLSSHTGPITQVAFMQNFNILLTSSKDTSIKFWDLDTNHCFKTLLGHLTEVWSFVLMRHSEFLVTGCGDSELRVWHLQYNDVTRQNEGHLLDEDDEDSLSQIKCVKLGSVLRSSIGRVVGMTQNNGNILAVHGASDTLELFLFHSHLESLRRMRRRKRKERKKTMEEAKDDENETPFLQDIVKRLPIVKTKGKIKASSLILGKGTELRILLVLNNNAVEVFGLDTSSNEAVPKLVRGITQQGHHSEIRALAFSSDNLAIASGAADAVKLWNRASLTCLRTIPTGYVLSLIFVPGDRHVIAGLKDGNLLVIDVSSGEIIEEISAHTGEVWSVCLSPDLRGCVSGGGDCTVKFWDFELIKTKKNKAKVLSLLHKRTLTLEEHVLCVRITPNMKLIAVALLDMTIKVFFVDTLKFFISLYGHKLPVVSMDISDDSTLLVSGSTDRNIKLWGLDFGDCHKSIFAHDAAISCVQFIHDTHYFFSCGKEGRIKQWDGDTYDKIVELRGHFGEAWVLTVSPNGEHIVSAGSDRVLRLISKTNEPLVLEDEAEEERAREEQEQLVTGPESTVRGQGDLNLPSRKTVGSERAAEQLIECLQVSKVYKSALDEFVETGKRGQEPAKPYLMLAYKVDDVDEFLLETLKRIRASDLEECLVLLPFSAACELLKRFPILFERGKEVELVSRTLTFLLKVHQGPIVSSEDLLPVLTRIQKFAFSSVNDLRDMVGTNLHGMQLIQRAIEQREGIQLFKDATNKRNAKKKKKKREERAIERAVMAI